MSDKDKLYDAVLAKRAVKLTQAQEVKFRWACEKTILENEGLVFSDWVVAAQIYLNLILSDPNLELGGLALPSK